MKRQTKRHRIIATFFLLIFFPTLVPTNLFASTIGPKSPEASSFEPVDASDMVNLITGQYSYVLPLLNVPSPEGGYPIALGYHAGIAMDQEASWAGLGWNVNPGAIDRSINGYPDDYNASKLNEYFWDRTHTETRYTASIGYSCGAASVGLGFNWGSNQALGGSVSVGAGMDLGAGNSAGVTASLGTNGASVGVGVQLSGALSFGVNANTEGKVEANVGYASNNGSGFNVSTSGNLSVYGGGASIGVSTSGTFSINAMGVSLSASKDHVSLQAGGVGLSTNFNNTISMGDYSTSSSGWMIPIIVPTPIGIFSASFGKQEFKYWMGKNVNNYITGPNYFYKGVNTITKLVYVKTGCHVVGQGYLICNGGEWKSIPIGKAFMDINEVSVNSTGTNFSSETDVVANNMTFPGYDNFSVSGQGICGSMSAKIYKNGTLFGLDGKENKEGYTLKYNVRDANASGTDFTKFNNAPQFQFDNEISTYLGVESAQFNVSTVNTNVLDYYSSGIDINDKPRRKTSSYIEYFTNQEITNTDSYAVLKANGFLKPSVSGFDRNIMPKDGIGAFKVTSVDGKTYHYSLPVYNHEVITRTFGVIPDSPAESQSYFEKRQLEPFATHWVLTAVTGPDFVDNGDGIAGEGDLGYWASFEYGKWTDAFVWKNPYKKQTLIDDKDSNVQTWIRGRKQLYYLDKIKTRTHSAIFVKGERQDAPSPLWDYYSADHINDKQNNSLSYRFTVPEQKQLFLEKIILLKNEDCPVNKGHEIYAQSPNAITHIRYNDSEEKPDLEAEYNMYDNIFDYRDDWTSYIPKAVKVINFSYDYSLVPGDNRLTLRSVNFRGKGGASALPPYKFDYINDTNTFNIDNKDGWGYNATNSAFFSLSKITTPQGGTINIGYEQNKFHSISENKIIFNNNDESYKIDNVSINSSNKLLFDIKSNNNFGIEIGDVLNVKYEVRLLCNVQGYAVNYTYKFLQGNAQVIQNLGNNKFKLQSVDNVFVGSNCDNVIGSTTSITGEYILTSSKGINGGGPRVANLITSDGINNYFTDYKYGLNEDGVGYVSYVPYSQNIAQEMPYSAELPAPRVMYEYVTMSSHKEGILPESKIRYRFNVMKEKSSDKIKFGDFYEIVKTANTPFVNSSDKEVSINSFTVKENFAALGQLLEVSTLNSKNQLLSKVYSTYYGINEIPNNMGVTQESYQSYKEVDYVTNTSTVKDKWVINSSTRIKYPSIIKSSTEQKNGYTYTTQFNDYDLVSGISKEKVYISSDGQSYKTRIVPAYTISQYNPSGGYGMKSKVDDPTNKNMLSQIAAEYSYIWDKIENKWKETGVGITTWSNIWSYKDSAGETTAPPTADKEKIWRKHKTFVWNGVKDGEGIFSNYNSATDDGFDWTIGVGSQPSKWKQVSETTLYNHFSSPLEMKDINNNYASTKMDYSDSKVLAVGNGRYGEIFYTGGENNWLGSGISGGSIYNDGFHTGKNLIIASTSSPLTVSMKNGEHRAGKYKLSVWVKGDHASRAALNVNGNPVSFVNDIVTAGGWQLKTAYVDVPSSACAISLTSNNGYAVYYDDLMIRPVASSITGYVYNEWDELSYIIGNNGLATKFEYDAAGRLTKTYSEYVAANDFGGGGFKLSKTNTYYNRFFVNYTYSSNY